MAEATHVLDQEVLALQRAHQLLQLRTRTYICTLNPCCINTAYHKTEAPHVLDQGVLALQRAQRAHQLLRASVHVV